MQASILFIAAAVALPATFGLGAPDAPKDVHQYVVKTWQQSTSDLPQNSVTALLQTSDGYLWVGTEEGLARFDGARFEVFDERNTPAMSSTVVYSLAEDASGRLWTGTGDGVIVRSGRQFARSTGLPEGAVVRSIVAQDSSVWLGTLLDGLYFCSGIDCARVDSTLGFTRDVAQTIEITNRVYVGTDAGVFARSDDGRFRLIPGTQTLHVQDLEADGAGGIWLATRAQGVYRLTPEGLVEPPDADSQWQGDPVFTMLRDHAGTLWMGLASGLTQLRMEAVQRFSSEDGLLSDRVMSLAMDREGSLWVGTERGGLHQFTTGAFTSINTDVGLPGDNVTTLTQASDGAIWIGTYGDGVALVDDQQIRSLGTADGLPSQLVTAIAEDATDRMWVGTIDAGIALFNHSGRRLSVVSGLPSPSVFALHRGPTGTMWVGTDSGLLGIAAGTRRLITTDDGLESNEIVTVLEEADGALFIGTYGGGLSILTGGEMSTLTTADGLGSNIVSALHRDSDGVLWIGTEDGGLGRMVGDSLVTLTTRDGLFDDKVFQILEDEEGYLWIGCNRGVYRISRSQVAAYVAGSADAISFDSFGTDDGMSSAEVNGGTQPAGLRSGDGRLWFPTTSGVAIVDPTEIHPNVQVPPVVIESVVADNLSLDIVGGSVHIPAGVRRIDISVAGLSLVEAGAVRYRFWMQDFDDGWSEETDQRRISYTHLRPGSYRFRVTAANNDGVWSEEGASIQLVLQPFVWQTLWFWGLIALGTMLALAVGYRRRVRKLVRQRGQLEDMVSDRTRDVLAAKDQLEAQSEELRTSLRDKEILLREVHHRVKNNLQMISSLLRLQSQQIDDADTKALFEDTRDRIFSISMVHDRLYKAQDLAYFDFVEYLRGITGQLMRAHGNDRVSITVDADQLELEVDRAIPCGLIVTEFVTNALRHGFPADRTGTIAVEVIDQGDSILLSVEDDGVGFPIAAPGEAASTLGLRIVHALALRLGGRLFRNGMPKQGTRFEVEFPKTAPGLLRQTAATQTVSI